MQLQASVDIDVPPGRVWAAMSDVERWHEWTASITSVQRLDDGEFSVGSTARIKQPRLPALVWRVTSLERGVGFVWEAKAPGAHTVGGHRVVPRGDGSRVALTIRQTGVLASILAPLTSRLTSRYMEMEAAGLKARCEHGEGQVPNYRFQR